MELNNENARIWEENANIKKDDNEPRWSWDCNFKLDFDGPLLSLCSRFYPPYNNIGKWEGNVSVNLLDVKILKKEFKCDTLDELKIEVEKFSKHYINSIKSRLI